MDPGAEKHQENDGDQSEECCEPVREIRTRKPAKANGPLCYNVLISLRMSEFTVSNYDIYVKVRPHGLLYTIYRY